MIGCWGLGGGFDLGLATQLSSNVLPVFRSLHVICVCPVSVCVKDLNLQLTHAYPSHRTSRVRQRRCGGGQQYSSSSMMWHVCHDLMRGVEDGRQGRHGGL